jgi:hypothetical protein
MALRYGRLTSHCRRLAYYLARAWIMFEFTESISITATRSEIWRRMVNIEQWWPPSNPEHTSIGVRPAGAHI